MDNSKIPLLRKTTKAVVAQASKPGGALEREEFTMAIARRSISVKMGLGEDGLDGGEWKGIVKGLVQRALEDVAESSPPRHSSPLKFKADDRVNTNADVEEHGEEEEEVEEVEEIESPQPKRRRPSPKPLPRRKGQQAVSSDEDDDAVEESEVSSLNVATSSKRSKVPKSSSSRAKRSEEPLNNTKKSSAKRKSPQGGHGSGKGRKGDKEVVDADEEMIEKGEKSESEMSSLYDVAPAKRRKSEGGTSTTSKEGVKEKQKKMKRPKKDPNEGLTPNEAKVADLKKIVAACGVRKQWSKEFADHPTAKEQKRHLEKLLLELGMKGAPSLGKARSLKEKRELAAELDDVVEFEAARGVSGGRSSRSEQKVVVEEDEEDEETNGSVKGAKDTFADILDFLGDDESD